MIGLQITLAILLPIFLLLLARVRVVFLFRDTTCAYVRFLFIKIPLYPKKKKRVRPSDYNYEKHRKRLAKQRKKRRKQRKEREAVPRTAHKPTFRAQIRLYGSLIRRLYPHFLRHFRMDITRLHIRVGTGDAATTAIATGLVSQALAYLLEFLSLHTRLHPTHRADIAVIPDFLAERSTADCKILFSLRAYAVLGLGIRFFYHLLTSKMKNLRDAQNKEDTSCLKTS